MIDGSTGSVSNCSCRLFLRLFITCTRIGVGGENRPGMILAQSIQSLPREVGSSIEQPGNICLSTRCRPAIAGRSKINDFHAYCDSADWLATVRANFRIDMRLPAFDRRLVEFCIGIPE